ncbi:pecanex-like protein 4 [Penaeus chinensis]|uniref:pecanex-like protein 4 n=1 Tax=Penaeus chinensis TaxID=139456 RepID=UPI001FB66A64|nr:pecanex-like protein 4 [Penaeus chinensis]
MDDFLTTARLAWAPGRVRMESPLVNSYKKPFIFRRLIETFFGGLRLFASQDVPVYIYLMQILLFSGAPLLCTLFIALEHHGHVTLPQAIFSNGAACLIYAFLTQTLAFCLRNRRSKSREIEQMNLASDEEVLLFDSPIGARTWAFLIREKRLIASIIVHSVVCGIVCGSAVYYVRPKTILEYNVSWGLSLAYTIIGLITVGSGVWPLIGGPTPEPALYRPLPFDLGLLSRPLHILFCVLIYHIHVVYPHVAWLSILDMIGHIIFISFLILWLLGIMPPIDAFVFWLLEQWIVVALGGSPVCSDGHLIGYSFFGTLSLFNVATMPTFDSKMIIAAGWGFFLSLDIGWMIASLLSHHVKFLTGMSGKYEETHPVGGRTSLRRVTCRRELAFFLPLFIAVMAISIGIHLPNMAWYGEISAAVQGANKTIEDVKMLQFFQRPFLFEDSARNITGSVILVITALLLILNEFQKVYILGLFKNPLYAYQKRIQKSFLMYIVSQFIQLGCPFISMLFLHQVITAELYLQVTPIPRTFTHLLYTIPVVRCFRGIWQFSQAYFIQLSAFFLLDLIYRETDLLLGSWGSFPPATRIFFISLSYLWGTRFVQRLSTVIIFMLTSVLESKQRSPRLWFLIGFNIGLFPILLCVLAVSSITAAPLLPLFTLPIFLLGFPRPLRSWPYPVGRASNSCEDSVYYEQLTPHVIFAMHNLLQSGSLGLVEPGEHFLLRFEDRFLWIQILECGYTFQYYSVKGLELQETSCHTAEASRVDANFSRAFDSHGAEGPTCLNPHAAHTLTPLTQINVLGYSDTKNVLTGVIDSPDTLKVVNDYFQKALLYVIFDCIVNRSALLGNSFIEVERRTSSSANSRSGDVLKSLPKLSRRTEVHFEENVPLNDMEEGQEQNKDRVSTMSGRISQLSSKTPSGRSSRLAWIDDQRLYGPVVEISPPSSWDDSEDPLDQSSSKKRRLNPKRNEDIMNAKNKDRNQTSLPPIHSKPQTYLSSLEDLTDVSDKVQFLPGIMYDSSSDDGLEAHAVGGQPKATHRSKLKSPAKINMRVISRTELRTPIYNSPLSAALAPSSSWFLDLPLESEMIDEVQDNFPHAWFKFLLNHFGRMYVENRSHRSADSKASRASRGSGPSSTKSAGDKEDQIQRMQYDETLEESYRYLIGACHVIVLGSDNHPPTPTQVYKTFSGEIPWSMALDWLLTKDLLYELVLRAYRVGVKLALDHTLIGGITGWAELLASLDDYCCNWYLGPDIKSTSEAPANPRGTASYMRSDAELAKPKSWSEAVKKEVPNLFSLGYNAVKGVFTSHLLSLGKAEIAVGRLGAETVRGLWASLMMELLYLTNDDDERYSIQAQPGLLRNLTVQAADPPLGYPIFSSPPLRLALIWLNATYEQLPQSRGGEEGEGSAQGDEEEEPPSNIFTVSHKST